MAGLTALGQPPLPLSLSLPLPLSLLSPLVPLSPCPRVPSAAQQGRDVIAITSVGGRISYGR